MSESLLSQRDFNSYTIPDRPSMPAVEVASDDAGVIALSRSINFCSISAPFDFWFQLEGENDAPADTIADLLTADAEGKQAALGEYRAAWGWFQLPMKLNFNKIHYKRKSGEDNGRITVWEGK